MFNKATRYLEAGKNEKAISLYKKIDPKFKELYLNLGNAYRNIGDFQNSLLAYSNAVSSAVPYYDGVNKQEYYEGYNNLGMLAYAVGDDTSALAYYTKCLNIAPTFKSAIWNYSNAKLRSSGCVSGWDKYEYRFKRENGAVPMDPSISLWDGVSSGNHITVMTEQGIGDKIMFGRYVNCLRPYFSKITVVCHPSLDWFFSDFSIARVYSGGVAIPLCSLARIFGINVSESYLPPVIPHSFGSGLNIGVCWSGSKTHANDSNRSCPSHYFSALPGNKYSFGMIAKGITDLGVESWEKTASYLLGLDLLVSVDTSIVHLAGSLGVPTLMLQPKFNTDFRWSHSWYKSVVVVPNPNDWNNVFERVKLCIK